MENNERNAMFCILKDGVSAKPMVIGTTFHFSKQAKSISDKKIYGKRNTKTNKR